MIPIVGQDLLTIEIEGQARLLYSHLAGLLASQLNLPDENLPAPATLNDVVCQHLARHGQLEDVYTALKRVLRRQEAFPLPAPLVKLAEIAPFRLFVTTTFDSLLERAIDSVRHGGQPRTTVFSYSPQDVRDLPSELQNLDGAIVFHLLGRVSAVPEYAVTEEDTLEFIHCLQSDLKRPRQLFDQLTRAHVLIIGSGFTNWLARFLIRIAKRERLWVARAKTDVVADARMASDADLISFLRHFSERTRVFSGGAVEFVDELHRRWRERSPGGVAPLPAVAPIGEMEPGAVFLSYASEDRSAAATIAAALEGQGLAVWFDRRQLQGGDAYEARIRYNIERASAFVPVLSKQVLTPDRRFFRLEWAHAERVAQQAPPNATFIVPVVIDETSPVEPALPERFRQIHWTSLPGGRTTPAFLERMRHLFRERQKVLRSLA